MALCLLLEQFVIVDKSKTRQQEANGDLLKPAREKDQIVDVIMNMTLTTRDGRLKNESRDTAEGPT